MAAFEAIDAARGDITLTFFEFNALAALHVFRARGVEVAVLEVGLGGRLDAVNIVDAEAAIVCSIGLDHADWLGTDIDGIGREKAGVFRPDSLAVLADPAMTPSVQAEVQRNLELLNTQIAEANARIVSSVGQGGSAFIQNAILGPLADKRVATLNRIETAIGRNAARPEGLEKFGTCSLNE